VKLLALLLCTSLVPVAGCKNNDPVVVKTAPASTEPVASAPPAAPAKPAAYQRTARTCAEIIAGLKGGMGGDVVTPGSWGDAPKELQVVPPGGELCGASSTRNTPVIRSALFGDELGAFYQPIATAMGCTWKGVEINSAGDRKTTQVKFKCPAKNGASSMIHTDSGSEFYYVSY